MSLWVRLGKSHPEQIESASSLRADIEQTSWQVRDAPQADIRPFEHR
jgi:hypothetical protein